MLALGNRWRGKYAFPFSQNDLEMFRSFQGYKYCHPCILNLVTHIVKIEKKISNLDLDQFPLDF